MAQVLRKAQPECLRYFLMLLRGPASAIKEEYAMVREESCTTEELVLTLINVGGYTASKFIGHCPSSFTHTYVILFALFSNSERDSSQCFGGWLADESVPTPPAFRGCAQQTVTFT